MPSLEEQLEALAEKMVEESLAPVRATTPPEQLELLRHQLLSELLVNPDGRRRLRQCLDDPETDRSGERETVRPGRKKDTPS